MNVFGLGEETLKAHANSTHTATALNQIFNLPRYEANNKLTANPV